MAVRFRRMAGFDILGQLRFWTLPAEPSFPSFRSGERLPSRPPDQLQRHTRAGALHDLFSLIGFLALTVTCFGFALSDLTRWTIYSIASGVLFTTTMAPASAVLDQHERWVDLDGLVQRVLRLLG